MTLDALYRDVSPGILNHVLKNLLGCEQVNFVDALQGGSCQKFYDSTFQITNTRFEVMS